MAAETNDSKVQIVDKTEIIRGDKDDLIKEDEPETPKSINKKAKKEAYTFIDNLEKIMYKEAGPKNFNKFIEALGAKFPVSLGEDFKDFDHIERAEAVKDMVGERALELYNQSKQYLINDENISFFLKGGGSIHYPLNLSFEGNIKKKLVIRRSRGGTNERLDMKLKLEN